VVAADYPSQREGGGDMLPDALAKVETLAVVDVATEITCHPGGFQEIPETLPAP
jgi:hypothetical protein